MHMETYNFVDLQCSQKSQLSKVHPLEARSFRVAPVHTRCIFLHLTEIHPENCNSKKLLPKLYKFHTHNIYSTTQKPIEYGI